MELWFLRRMPQFRGYNLSKMFEDMLNEQKAIDIDKAWQFIEVTIIREGHASEDFVKEMNWRFNKTMKE